MAIDWFPLWLSLRVAALSTLIAVALGLWIAYWLACREFRGKAALDGLVALPLVLPPTVLGYYLLVVLGQSGPIGRMYEAVTGSPLVFSWQAAVVAALFYSLPLLVRSARAALESVHPDYARAAQSLGVSERRIFFRITLPLAWRPLLAAAVVAFARSLGDFGVTLMIAGNIPGRTQTVTVAVYDAVQAGNGALARTLVVIISAVTLASLWIAGRLSPRQALP
ncbi:MAG: molybdate ABC transporter permease subunit [Acidobacteria bacterium]|nr:molybdate ABC transporter permease subunit [Acidobacteriota bacterium]